MISKPLGHEAQKKCAALQIDTQWRPDRVIGIPFPLLEAVCVPATCLLMSHFLDVWEWETLQHSSVL